jgi:hemerythrin-like domain-containing protein
MMADKQLEHWDPLGTMNPIDLLDEEHRLFLDACAALETVADKLPDEADLELAQSAAEVLLRNQPGHHEDEFAGLFPLLRRNVGREHTLSRILDQLEVHRTQDIDILTEIAEVLQIDISNKRPHNPGMLGYMLRSYFTNERRHIAWERQFILPAARILLTESDVGQLADKLRASNRFLTVDNDRLAVRKAITPAGKCWACHVKSTQH